MPTYDYECTICGHRFEAFHGISEPPLSGCPKCKKKVRRLIGGGTGIIFKGSGFYATDSKKSGGKKTATGDEKPSTVESKPDTVDVADKKPSEPTATKKEAVTA